MDENAGLVVKKPDQISICLDNCNAVFVQKALIFWKHHLMMITNSLSYMQARFKVLAKGASATNTQALNGRIAAYAQIASKDVNISQIVVKNGAITV